MAEKDYVEYFLPPEGRGPHSRDPRNVIINGKKYSVPRGQKVKVPAVVAEVLDQSAAQDAYAAEIDMKMQQEQVTKL